MKMLYLLLDPPYMNSSESMCGNVSLHTPVFNVFSFYFGKCGFYRVFPIYMTPEDPTHMVL
jgi:hypothetical protein